MSGYIDSKTPRGPQRWLRALNNWEANPDSPAAQLFAGRLRRAKAVTEQYGDDRAVRAFLKNSRTPEWRVDFYTCSAFCASMQVQLEFSSSLKVLSAELHDALIVAYLSGDEASTWTRVERRLPVRTARCQTCGRTIHAHTTDDDPLFTWPEDRDQWRANDAAQESLTPEPVRDFTEGTTAVAVDADGVIVDLKEIRVVRLTDREHELFVLIDSDDKRTFAQKHGIPLGL